ncbi:MAG: glycerol-3-phosphate 1-O-acyltransferase PlsY [Burkholderiales bacterium]|nr:glycerol-3-phosphate 1-O-acyltransferase PlsY [Burkholderiales bacterium]
MLPTLLTLTAAYLIGSVAFAVLVSRLYGLPDPRSFGSGNPGATNVLRTGRRAAAALTLFGDALKGAVAVWLAAWAAQRWGLPAWVPPAAGLAAFAGHVWPVFFGFRGGKGVATALGVLLALDARLALACAVTWLTVFALGRISSLAALTAAGLAPLYAWWLTADGMLTAAVAVLALAVWWRHAPNIRKLLRGEEAAFGRKR